MRYTTIINLTISPRDIVGRIWQIAHLTKRAARLIKCAHLTNLHTRAAFRRGKV